MREEKLRRAAEQVEEWLNERETRQRCHVQRT
jgi:hypothetical protein